MKPLFSSCITLILGTGCATSFNDDRFPTREDLLELARKPAPAVKDSEAPVAVNEWTLAGPFPDRFAEHVPAVGSAGAFLEELVPGRSSEGLTCMARELGRFVAAKEKRPEPLLERFMLGRCGNSVHGVGYYTLTVETDEDERAIYARYKSELAEWMMEGDPAARFGIAVLREGKKALLIATQGTPKTKLETTTQIAADGKLQVSGSVDGIRKRLTAIEAKITRGALGVEKCARDERIALPRFSFTCPVGDDVTASLVVGAWEEGRVLGRAVAELTVLSKAAAANVFKRVEYIPPTPLPPPDALGAAFLRATNDIRQKNNLAPLIHAAAQDKIGNALAIRYFADMERDDREKDMIALGVLAGWEVKDIIIGDGDFNAFVTFGEGMHDVMARAFASPWLRSMLMRKESNVASIAVTKVGDGYGVLLATYEPLVTPDTAMATRVFESLRAARRARGVSDLMILPVGDAEKRAVISVHEGKDPMKALDTALYEAVSHRGSGLLGWVVRAQDLERIDWPEELLSARSTSVAMAIGTYKHEKAAWGALIMFVIAEIDDAQVALLRH